MMIHDLKIYYTPSIYEVFIEGRPNGSRGFFTHSSSAEAFADVNYDVVHDSIYLLRLDWNDEEGRYCYTGDRKKIEEMKYCASEGCSFSGAASFLLSCIFLFFIFVLFALRYFF